MEYNTTLEQQQSYVEELQAMWSKVARIHGYDSPQEVAILKVLSAEKLRLAVMEVQE